MPAEITNLRNPDWLQNDCKTAIISSTKAPGLRQKHPEAIFRATTPPIRDGP